MDRIGIITGAAGGVGRAAAERFARDGWSLVLTDVTDARILAEQLEWAATTPAAYGHAFNISNGDLFRWRWLWPQLAAYFGVEPQGPPTPIAPLEGRMQNARIAQPRLGEPCSQSHINYPLLCSVRNHSLCSGRFIMW